MRWTMSQRTLLYLGVVAGSPKVVAAGGGGLATPSAVATGPLVSFAIA
jgi:hypothetical protein